MKFPFLGPWLGLFVLAKLNQDGVFTLLETGVKLVMINARAPVIFITTEDQLVVHPDFPGILAAQS